MKYSVNTMVNVRIPIKTSFDTVAVALVSAGVGMVTLSETDTKMYAGIMLIALGFLAFILRNMWNENSKKTPKLVTKSNLVPKKKASVKKSQSFKL